MAVSPSMTDSMRSALEALPFLASVSLDWSCAGLLPLFDAPSPRVSSFKSSNRHGIRFGFMRNVAVPALTRSASTARKQAVSLE